MKEIPSHRLTGLALIVLAFLLAGAAGARNVRPFSLVPSEPLDLAVLKESTAASTAPALKLREIAVPATGKVLAPVPDAVPKAISPSAASSHRNASSFSPRAA